MVISFPRILILEINVFTKANIVPHLEGNEVSSGIVKVSLSNLKAIVQLNKNRLFMLHA